MYIYFFQLRQKAQGELSVRAPFQDPREPATMPESAKVSTVDCAQRARSGMHPCFRHGSASCGETWTVFLSILGDGDCG